MCCDDSYQIVVVAFVPVSCYVDAIVQEAEIGTDVKLVFLFVGQCTVFKVLDVKSRFSDTT